MIEEQNALSVITLGRFALLRNQGLISGGNWNQRRVRELFKLLLSAEQHRLHREQVQELLWPSSSVEQAANSFGKTLYLLRRALEPDLASGKASSYVALDHDTLILIPDSMQIDADLFETMAKQIQSTLHGASAQEPHAYSTLDAFDRVLSLYGGDYLPDDLYEDWAQRRRDKLRRRYCWLLEQAAKIALVGMQGQRACEYLQALLEYNSTDEQTQRDLMLVYARMGRRSDALNQYQVLRAALREELRTNPLAETVELYRVIQAGSIPVDLVEERHVSGKTATTELSSAPLHTHAHPSSDTHTHYAPTLVIPNPDVSQQIEVESNTTVGQLAPEHALHAELIGRSEELQRLRLAYAQVRGGQQRVFFIHGEAGIGKTRLAHEFSSWVETRQATVLWGNCYEMSGSLPYQPIIDMLTTHIHSSNAEQVRALAGTNAVDLAKLVPEVRIKIPELSSPESLGPEVERRNLYNAMASYFHASALERPLLLILDDLQWADTATIQFLGYLLMQHTHSTTDRNPALFFLLLYRGDEVHETHPLRTLLSGQMRTGYAEEMRLLRLGEDEVQQLLVQMAGHTVRASFAEEIYKHTEGNPFFIRESIRALIEEGKIKKVGEHWQTTVALEELALPTSVRLLIEQRLAHVSPECRVTLAYAAVLGRQFHSALLCQARGLSEEHIAEHVDDALRTHILMTLDEPTHETRNAHAVRQDQDADLMFTHDKIREVLALWLNPLRRRAAHRQVAQAIETHYASRLSTQYSKLAYHYQVAEETIKAVEYLQKAAVQATSVYAFADAIGFTEKAIELLLGEENRPQRAELLRTLSVDAYLYIGRPDKAIEAGIAASTLWRELSNPVKEAESLLDVSFSFHWMGRETDAIVYIKRALACLAHAPDETRLLAKAYVQWGLSATISGNVPEALEQLQRADTLHDQIGGNDPFIGVVSLWARSWCAFAVGTLQQMLDYAVQSAALCRATRMLAWEPMMTYSAAWALMLMGRLDEAAVVAQETLEKAERHNALGAQGWANLVFSFVAIQQGQWDTAEHFGEKAAAIANQMKETGLLARVFWGRSICAGWRDDWNRAVTYSLEAISVSLRDGEHSLVYPYLLLQSAKAYFFAGNIVQAQQALEQSTQFAQEHQYRQLPAIAHRLHARILQTQGLFEQAHQHFEQSLAELAELHDTVEYARTQQAYGLFFHARNRSGDQERGAALLEQAAALFQQLGVNG